MIKQILPIVVACVAPCFALEGWLTNLDEAKKQAAAQNKDLFIEFTGSDWCPPCKQLRAAVFSTPAFITEAQKHFVLVELDYPHNKPQSAEEKQANERIAQEYGVQAFPTVVIADAQGKPFGGFVGGHSAQEVDTIMQDALKSKKALAEAQDKLAKATNDDAKIAALTEILSLAPPAYIEQFYGAEKKQLMDLDKEDKSGLRAAEALKQRHQQETAAIEKYLSSKLNRQTPPQEVVAVVQAYPDADKLLPENRQSLLMLEFNAFLSATGDIEKALQILDKLQAIDPNTRLGARVPALKKHILDNQERIKATVAEMQKQQQPAPKQ